MYWHKSIFRILNYFVLAQINFQDFDLLSYIAALSEEHGMVISYIAAFPEEHGMVRLAGYTFVRIHFLRDATFCLDETFCLDTNFCLDIISNCIRASGQKNLSWVRIRILVRIQSTGQYSI